MTQDPLSYLSRLATNSTPSPSSSSSAATSTTTTTSTTTSASLIEPKVEGAAKLSSLLLRLFNDTFLSLPIVDCYNLTQLRPTWTRSAGADDHIRHDNVYDACFINWSQAKLVQNSRHTSSEIQNEVFLSNFIDGSGHHHHHHHQQQPLDSAVQNLMASASNVSTLTERQIDYELVKRAYLSVSSLLSVCGILINLFIISIIIFNTRQRRPAARSNNIGKNNLLLIQLTITGILLSSYVLIDNISIQNQTDEPLGATNSATFGLQHHFCNTNTNPSPLLTFLPPTPFHWHPLQCTNRLLSDQMINRLKASSEELVEADDGEEEEDEEEEDVELISTSSANNREPPALILKFHKHQQMDSQNKTTSSPWFLDFNSEDNKGARSPMQIDLSDFLDSIFVVETNCLYWNSPKERAVQGGRLRKRLLAGADREYNDSDSDTDYEEVKLNQTRYRSIKLLLAQLHPLLVNVIGSVYIWTVAALAYDRYCAIAHPLQYLRSIHTSRTRTFFLLSWAISLGLNIFLPISTRQVILERENQLVQRASGGQNHYIISQWYSWIVDNIGQDLYEQTTSREQPTTGAKFLASIHHYNNREIVRECLFSLPLMASSASSSSSSLSPEALRVHGSNFVPIDRFERVWSRSKAIMRAAQARSSLGNSQTQIGRASKMKSDLVSELASILVESSSKIAWLQNNPDKFSERFKLNIENKSSSSNPKGDDDENSYVARLIIYSLLGFVIIILIPLLIITICNIRIYRIVKVHERRLSISSASNMAAQHRHCNNSLGEEDEEVAEVQVKEAAFRCSSVVSRLRSKLWKLGSLRRVPPPIVTSRRDFFAESSAGLEGPNEDILIEEQTLAKNRDSDTVSEHCASSRSKRSRIAQQDSYRLLDDNQLKEAKNLTNKQNFTSSASIQSNLRIKMKISDHGLSIEHGRESVASQHFNSESLVDGENYSALNSPSATGCQNFTGNNNNNSHGGEHKYESGGIFNQLKMAGLSFAGIAIQKRDFESAIFHKNAPLKSASCSLANLSSMNWSSANPKCHTSSLHRFNMEQQQSGNNHQKKSYVSLDAPTCRQLDQEQPGMSKPAKYITRLLDDDSSSPHIQGNHHHHHHHNHSHQTGRLTMTLGTKSATFNIVIWLIITMLIFTLPHYVLVTMDHIMKLNSSDNLNNYLRLIHKVDLDIYQQQLQQLVQLIFSIEPVSRDSRRLNLEQLVMQIQNSNLSSSSTEGDSSFLKMSSIWLSCLCRVLFLSMVPLNGCLYGISSRSLRTTLRMILKRYISKKQAFIEIDQRHRSISSDRSRDSSFINQLPLYYGHQNNHNSSGTSSSACLSCNYRPPDGHERLIRRCSSFSVGHSHLCRQQQQQQHKFCNNSTSSPNDSGRESYMDDRLRNLQEKKSQQNNANTIRFLIGDQNIHDLFNEAHRTPSPPPPPPPPPPLPPGPPPMLPPKRYKLPSWPLMCRNNESQSLSTGSSIKSLMSASINSSLSLACSIIDEKIYSEQVLNGGRGYKSPNEELKRKKSLCSPNGGALGNDNPNNLGHDSGVQVSSDEITIECPATGANDEKIMKINSDTINPPSINLSPPGENGDFKCFITLADQKEQKLVDIENQEAPKTRLLRETSSCLWSHIRQNLTRILLDASARLLSLGLKEQKEKNSGICRASWSLKVQAEAHQAHDLECRTSLLRRNSLDSHKSNSMSTRHKHQRYLETSSCQKCRDHRLKSSLTMSSLGLSSIGRGEPSSRPACCHHLYHSHKRGSSASLNQSPTYLKPPSFLKLQFDPNNPDQGYSVASALSPIKECSSNHSFASSQSSLGAATASQQNKAPGQWNRIQ